MVSQIEQRGEQKEPWVCACGCGGPLYNRVGAPQKSYVIGHHPKRLLGMTLRRTSKPPVDHPFRAVSTARALKAGKNFWGSHERKRKAQAYRALIGSCT